MAHEFETGFFSRQAAWHGLGTVLEKPPQDTMEAYRASELNWEVRTMPMFANTPDERWLETGHRAIVRSTDDRVLGVVKERYTPYQNVEAFSWTTPLIESGYWEYEAAGSLRKGEQCWILLQQREVEIVPNDLLRQYLMISWSHSGKSANYVQPTSIRVVCQNTMNQALNESGVMRTAVRHSQFVQIRMETIKELLHITTDAFEDQRMAFESMAKKQLTAARKKDILEELFPIEGLEGRAATIAEANRDLVELAIEKGSGIQENGLAGTHYGMFVGISEALEHYLGGNRITDRGDNILFRGGKKKLDQAYQLLAV